MSNQELENRIRNQLFSMQDLEYKKFHCSLIPNIDPENVIGIRIPKLRSFAKNLDKSDAEEFVRILPHKYYEENNIHGLIIENFKDYEHIINELDIFLPYIDNWATCDMISPKIFKRHISQLYPKINEWIRSGQTYTVRFGLGMLMKFFLDENFSVEILETASSIKSDEYYINMMIAWFFATALAKQYDSALPYFLEHRLSAWTHNKAIQKSLESYRIPVERKVFLKGLKIKNQ